jgi:hypothetical protein
MNIKLDTTDSEFSALEMALEKRGSMVRVPVMALRHLVYDHVTLLAAARKGNTVEAGTDQASLR